MAIQRQDGWANDSGVTLTTSLEGKERRFVTRVTGGIRLAQNGEQVAGVLQEGKAVGLTSSFATSGYPLKVIASAAFTVGAAIMCGADGTAIVGTTNQVGVSRNAGASGELCEVMFDRVS